jgi:hypothetical protein
MVDYLDGFGFGFSAVKQRDGPEGFLRGDDHFGCHSTRSHPRREG